MRKPQELKTYEQAKEKALRLLEFRSHSEKELTYKLRQNGADDEIIEQVLEFCRNYNFVNDAEYAKRKAKDLYNIKKYGRRRIEQELWSKGISSEDIAEAVSEIDFENDERLEPLVRKRLNGDFDRKNIDKCIRYFMYRGYNYSAIRSCIETIKGEADEL